MLGAFTTNGPKGPAWGLVYASAILFGSTQIPHRGPPFRRSPQAIYTEGLDPGDPLLRSERKQGCYEDPFYGRARWLPMLGSFKT